MTTEAVDRLGSDIDVPFRFKRKPMPIAAELRPDWKIATLLLILRLSSHGGKSSLRRLHVLNWSIRSPRFRKEFEDHRKNPLPLFNLTVRLEPAFSRAIDLAVGNRLVSWVGGNRLQLTAKGSAWVNDIVNDDLLMRDEKEFLLRIGKSITETAAKDMFSSKGGW
jgi:hypothetical protein